MKIYEYKNYDEYVDEQTKANKEFYILKQLYVMVHAMDLSKTIFNKFMVKT